MFAPLVSIAIPCYKARFLKEAISSVLSQTYHNIEVIVVNDQSPENISGIIASFSDSRIRYYINDKNIGAENPANNWNKCLSYARGEYFCLLCDDDIYEPDFVEQMLFLAKKHPNADVFRSRANFINAAGKELNRYASAPEWESMEDYLWHVCRDYRSQTISEWFYRTKVLKENNGYALLPLAWYADYLSIYRFSRKGGIVSTYRILVHFRLSGENISSQDNKNNIKKIEAQNLFRSEVEKLLEGNPNKSRLMDMLNWLLRLHLKYNLNYTPRKTLLWLFFHRKQYGVHKSLILKALWHNKS